MTDTVHLEMWLCLLATPWLWWCVVAQRAVCHQDLVLKVGSFVVHCCQHREGGEFESLSYSKHTWTLMVKCGNTWKNTHPSLWPTCKVLHTWVLFCNTRLTFHHINSLLSLSFKERAGCKMQMIQDGQFTNAPEKPLRMTGLPESCKVLSTLVLILLQL